MSALAVGWATVDLDRAAGELASRLVAGTTFEDAPDCAHLGAACRVGRLAEPTVDGAALLVLLEPSTEGRLAETLARHDEGPCATWWPADAAADAGADAIGEPAPPTSAPPTSAQRPGPFGPERIVLGGPRGGPHRLLVEAATIAS
jgi:hypothetical protein